MAFAQLTCRDSLRDWRIYAEVAQVLITRARTLYAGEALLDELRGAVFTETETFEERPGKDFISVRIYVERESQKGIVIGDRGAMLKRIGQEARAEIEQLTGRPAYLELWVKVRHNWRRTEFDLDNFGFRTGKRKKKGGRGKR